MTIFDYIVLGIIGFTILLGLMRGAVREILSMLGWMLAFYLANKFNADVIRYLPDEVPTESIKVMAAFVLIFLAVLLLSSLLALLLTGLLKAVGLGGLNRLLGAFTGALRGLLFVCVLVMLTGMTDIPRDARWTNAMLSAPLEALVIRLLPLLPSNIAAHVHLEHQPVESELIL
ncbi:CvpA family protein [Methylophilus aquaticus]|uniref:CvpA family protein n=1 Tax=Methylophilus aquaticus TaxID=1971610 RepID=A0ABT9JVK7_9PROT|nr:CvpA family protein [Methylophilus aquaticus]MDP8568633.1 CvpA family protein [Methylophilus aquaticus]